MMGDVVKGIDVCFQLIFMSWNNKQESIGIASANVRI